MQQESSTTMSSHAAADGGSQALDNDNGATPSQTSGAEDILSVVNNGRSRSTSSSNLTLIGTPQLLELRNGFLEEAQDNEDLGHQVAVLRHEVAALQEHLNGVLTERNAYKDAAFDFARLEQEWLRERRVLLTMVAALGGRLPAQEEADMRAEFAGRQQEDQQDRPFLNGIHHGGVNGINGVSGVNGIHGEGANQAEMEGEGDGGLFIPVEQNTDQAALQAATRHANGGAEAAVDEDETNPTWMPNGIVNGAGQASYQRNSPWTGSQTRTARARSLSRHEP